MKMIKLKMKSIKGSADQYVYLNPALVIYIEEVITNLDSWTRVGYSCNYNYFDIDDKADNVYKKLFKVTKEK